MTPPVTCRPWKPVMMKNVVPNSDAPQGLPMILQAPVDQVRPLVGLQAQEDRAAERRERTEHLGARPVRPCSSHSSALTIVTLEQISRNVMGR